MVVFGGSNGMRWMGPWGVFVGELRLRKKLTQQLQQNLPTFFCWLYIDYMIYVLIHQFHKGCVFAEDLYHSRMHQFQDLQKIGPFEKGYESIAIPLDQSEGSRLR